GGASRSLVENVWIENFYTGYETGANGNQNLADSNSLRKFSINNACNGVYYAGNQNDINDVQEAQIAATVAINSNLARPVVVFGGNFSATSSASASFTIGSVGSLTKGSCSNACGYSFTATISSPDANVGTVYNSYMVATAHFGVIPLTLTA